MILGSCHFGGLLAFVPRLVQAPWGSPDKGSVLASGIGATAGRGNVRRKLGRKSSANADAIEAGSPLPLGMG